DTFFFLIKRKYPKKNQENPFRAQLLLLGASRLTFVKHSALNGFSKKQAAPVGDFEVVVNVIEQTLTHNS
ncbi:hypothetical protein LJB87_03100, partial [Alistipes sp. OttesenSCG-928-L06]|nr:hypothetical protein [Alistipes sp. OttesenSCG-928-L06]